MDRRTFIKLTAITGTSATLASCGNPENQIIRFVPEDELMPGLAVFKPSVCPLCQSGCGLTVRVMDADVDTVRGGQQGVVRRAVAKKLEGNAAHPVNHGKLCSRGQAAIQVTYHPDRITQPLKRTGNRGAGTYEAIAWDAAIMELTSRLDAIAANPRGLAAIVGAGRGQRRVLVDRFLTAFDAPPALTFELFDNDVIRRANGMSFGREQLPTIDLARAQFALSFGADFLGTWNSPVAQSVAYGEMRQGRAGMRGSFVQVESRMSQTGANADEWVPVRPGTEGVLALALAQVIIAANLHPASAAGRAGALIEGWSSGLSSYTPEKVAELTGVRRERIERLAREFAERRPAVAFAGGAPLAHTNGLFTALAVNALNALVGGVNQPGGVFFTPQLGGGAAAPAAAGYRLAPQGEGSGIGDAQVLLLDGANPVFTAPRAWGVRDAIQKVPYIVSFGQFLDETSEFADLILPDHTFLESWSEAAPESGSIDAVLSVAPAVMRPLYDTRATGDVLLDVSRKLAKPLNLPWQTFDEMLKASFDTLPAGTAGDAWTTAQAQGGWWGQAPAAAAGAAPASAPAGTAVAFADAQFQGDAQQFPFYFLPYASSNFLDGSTAHLPWMQEMPDPLSSAMWSTWVEINPATATKLGINQGDVVEITSPQGKLQTAAVITPGIAPDMLAMPAGQGHTRFTRYASGRGANPVDLLTPATVAATNGWAWAATRVGITRVGPDDGRLVLFAGELREHTPYEELERGQRRL